MRWIIVRRYGNSRYLSVSLNFKYYFTYHMARYKSIQRCRESIPIFYAIYSNTSFVIALSLIKTMSHWWPFGFDLPQGRMVRRERWGHTNYVRVIGVCQLSSSIMTSHNDGSKSCSRWSSQTMEQNHMVLRTGIYTQGRFHWPWDVNCDSNSHLKVNENEIF